MKRFNRKKTISQCLLGILFGIAFIVLGIMLLIPSLGIFGLIATIIAIIVTNYYFYHLLVYRPFSNDVKIYDHSDKPVSTETHKSVDFDASLRKLEKLKADKLITEKEYKKKRKEIMNERW